MNFLSGLASKVKNEFQKCVMGACDALPPPSHPQLSIGSLDDIEVATRVSALQVTPQAQPLPSQEYSDMKYMCLLVDLASLLCVHANRNST